MEVTYQKFNADAVVNKDIPGFDPEAGDIETGTIDLTERFLEFIIYFQKRDEEVRNIMIDYSLFRCLRRDDEFRRFASHGGDESVMFYGVCLEPRDMGEESIDEFIITTDRRTYHSDMVEKDFVDELDVEEMLEMVNNRLENETSP